MCVERSTLNMQFYTQAVFPELHINSLVPSVYLSIYLSLSVSLLHTHSPSLTFQIWMFKLL